MVVHARARSASSNASASLTASLARFKDQAQNAAECIQEMQDWQQQMSTMLLQEQETLYVHQAKKLVQEYEMKSK